VETLLIYKDSVRENIFNGSGLFVTTDLDDDDYNNLLVVEKKISDLVDDGLIAPKELEIVTAMSTNKSLKNICEELNLSRWTISKIFSTTCEKIAYSLGGVFTDDGYIEYMVNKYNLNTKHINKLETYIKGAYKHKVRRYYEK